MNEAIVWVVVSMNVAWLIWLIFDGPRDDQWKTAVAVGLTASMNATFALSTLI